MKRQKQVQYDHIQDLEFAEILKSFHIQMAQLAIDSDVLTMDIGGSLQNVATSRTHAYLGLPAKVDGERWK